MQSLKVELICENLLINEIFDDYNFVKKIHFIHLQSLMFNLSFHGY